MQYIELAVVYSVLLSASWFYLQFSVIIYLTVIRHSTYMAIVCICANFLALLYEIYTQTWVAAEICLGANHP